MAENLRVKHYNNGDAIPIIVVDTAWAILTTGAYCWYNNNQTTNGKYGILYNWYTVDDSRGICPIGWHVPSDPEWTTLTTYLGPDIAGGKMKSISSLWFSPNVDATNNSGFSALPGGLRGTAGSFYNLGILGHWWSSTESSGSYVWNRYMVYDDAHVYRGNVDKTFGISLRCLKD
jgi:uncharacterized protein (TIGR02145 family)